MQVMINKNGKKQNNGLKTDLPAACTVIEKPVNENKDYLPGILFITSWPPGENSIATYTQDLIDALNNNFYRSFNIKICFLNTGDHQHAESHELCYVLDVHQQDGYKQLAKNINADKEISIVVIQHEFEIFKGKENELIDFLKILTKPVLMVLHVVFPLPDKVFKKQVQQMGEAAKSIVVLTQASANILIDAYSLPSEKISVIPHGTCLVRNTDKLVLKDKYNLSGKKVLSSFGLLSERNNIETTLKALPAIIKDNPDVIFIIMGAINPSVLIEQGYKYRNILDEMIRHLKLENHVLYLNYFLPLPELLDYLQLTDIYLFTSKDRNQVVSGTLCYALGAGCLVVSTPIPHALEILNNNEGIIVDFENSLQITQVVNSLLLDEQRRKYIASNGQRRMAPTAWENTAIAHALEFKKITNDVVSLNYKIPTINLDHIKRLTTDFGMMHQSVFNCPDISSGFTLDDNAGAMIAMCRNFELTGNKEDLYLVNIYFNFIKYCLQPEGYFMNYVDAKKAFSPKNFSTNLADVNGKAIWALGYLISLDSLLPQALLADAVSTIKTALLNVNKIHSANAMAFVIKGLYYRNKKESCTQDISLIKYLANRLVQMYKLEADGDWQWFERKFTPGCPVLPEALLCAWLATGEDTYKDIAKSTFDFLLTNITDVNSSINFSLNKLSPTGVLPVHKDFKTEQPVVVAYSILALSRFNDFYKNDGYANKMKHMFNWFLGDNHLHQIMYNPCTGGCYQQLEQEEINLNQGAASTVSYLVARLAMENCLSNVPVIVHRSKQNALL